ncbi:hypothetical protein [Bacillus sp. REN10]|uniref:hypothetical protein n=1 Tax=Bacillus sp. REN10 TaxID=2782541 RepID=UPI00193B8D02|nr:hypothetical protein [Bacillus sp. REN10]
MESNSLESKGPIIKTNETHSFIISIEGKTKEVEAVFWETAKKIYYQLSSNYSLYQYQFVSKRNNAQFGIKVSGLLNRLIKLDKVIFCPLKDINLTKDLIKEHSIIGCKNIDLFLREVEQSIEASFEPADYLGEIDDPCFVLDFYYPDMIRVDCNNLSILEEIKEII